MIKVVCINKKNTCDLGLTEGKIYQCSKSEWYAYGDLHIVNDNGAQMILWRGRFIPLAEWRDNQINSILDGD